MNIKIAAVSIYLMLVYSFSLHYPILNSLFYPTLGAFCFLFISRTYDMKTLSKIAFGAFLASTIGAIMYAINPSELSLLADTLVIIFLIKKFRWNAPPILSVSFIPFFSKSSYPWTIPLSVGLSLGILLVLLFLVHLIESLRTDAAEKQQHPG